MSNSVESQFNQANDCAGKETSVEITALIKQLSGKDDYARMQARETLICIGRPAVGDLVKTLETADTPLRWQIIKILECIQDPAAAAILVEQLKDDDAGVRWAASDALIALRSDAIAALLQALVRDFDSSWLRRGAHHILHVMKDSGRLNKAELDVYAALEDIEPMVAVPWAAEKALENLRIKK
jgi:HEAT repeat protein